MNTFILVFNHKKSMHLNKSPSTNNSHSPITVSTLHGDVVLNSKSVFVKIGDKFREKSAERLLEGEEFLRPLAGMPRITLDMADKGLRESNNRYVLSQHELFGQHNGTNHPVFQLALLSGMAQKHELWPEPIAFDAKITASFASGKPIELSCVQKEAAAQFIRNTLEAKGVLNPITGSPISADHIADHWLGGTVIAPRQYERVAEALSEIAPGMEKLLGNGFHEAYRTYLAIRHKIVNRVNDALFAEAKDGADSPSDGRPRHQNNGNGKSIHVDEEAAYLAGYFFSKVSKNFCVSRAIKIIKPHAADSHHVSQPRNGSPKSGLPAPAQEIGEIDAASVSNDRLPLKSSVEIARECYLLERIITGMATRFLHDNPHLLPKGLVKNEDIPTFSDGRVTPEGMKILKLNIQNFVFDLKLELAHQLGFKDNHMAEIASRLEKLDTSMFSFLVVYKAGSDPDVVSAAKSLAARIRDYSLDTYYGLSNGEILRVFEEENRRRLVLPSDVIYAKVLTDAKRIKEYKHEQQKTEFDLRKRFGEETRSSLPAISFRTEDRELEKLFRKPELSLLVEQFSQTFQEMDEAKALLEQIDAKAISQKSRHLYEFAYDDKPKPEPDVTRAIYGQPTGIYRH